MRYILAIMMGLLFCQFSIADTKQQKKQQEAINSYVNSYGMSFEEYILNPLNDEIDAIQKQIDSIQSRIDRIKDRKMPTASDSVTKRLNQYKTFAELYSAKEDLKLELTRYKGQGYKLADAYLFVIDMTESLDSVYSKNTNSFYRDNASSIAPFILEQHREEFNVLVNQINDYEFYMYELARLFEAADDDKYKSNAETLSKAEYADYLLDVPYTKNILEEYIKHKGHLIKDRKAELQGACPGAFDNLK